MVLRYMYGESTHTCKIKIKKKTQDLFKAFASFLSHLKKKTYFQYDFNISVFQLLAEALLSTDKIIFGISYVFSHSNTLYTVNPTLAPHIDMLKIEATHAKSFLGSKFTAFYVSLSEFSRSLGTR